tara:strand:- start:7 stop:141 length:135 start_codon:yes stop_codon:yes gene_type:complete
MKIVAVKNLPQDIFRQLVKDKVIPNKYKEYYVFDISKYPYTEIN